MGLFDRALLGAVDTGPLGRGRKFQPALDGRARQAAMDGRGACLGRVGWRGGDAVRVHGAAASSQQPAAGILGGILGHMLWRIDCEHDRRYQHRAHARTHTGRDRKKQL